MTYAKIENNQVIKYPVHQGDICLEFPNVSFPIPFSPPDGYVLVINTPPPSVEWYQFLEEDTPILVDGVWIQQWIVKERSDSEKETINYMKENEIRGRRNMLLMECDWTQLSNSPADSEVWEIYRQELRDITTQENFPWNVQWPNKPE